MYSVYEGIKLVNFGFSHFITYCTYTPSFASTFSPALFYTTHPRFFFRYAFISQHLQSS